ncbi:MAG: AI-2E family transporter [Tissierellia bacterium]|jgi:predicted PurR-regulated permease PerM|nr:AI-2E family transporter [Tissierellia bacterium]
MEDLIRLDGIKGPLQLVSWISVLIFALIAIYYLVNIGNRYLERSKRLVVDTRLVKKVLIGLLSLIIIIVLLRKYPILGRVFAAAFIAAILAYIINPLVDKLEKRGIKRALGVGIVYLSIILVISILMVALIPRTAQELRKLASSLPSIVESFSELFTDFMEGTTNFNFPGSQQVRDAINDSYESTMESLTRWVTTSASRITVLLTHFVQNMASVMLTLVLIMIMTFYFLVDRKTYVNKIKSIIPNSINEDFSVLAGRINVILTEFIRGRLILAVFVGTFTAILLLILRIDFAIVIGIITLIADIIPYIGPLLGFVPAFLFALIESPFKALIVAVFYVLIQWAENNILAPKIIGDSMGLNPLFIFLSIVIGGGIFGVWGMVVSVPLAAVGLTLIEFLREKYKMHQEQNKKDGTKV